MAVDRIVVVADNCADDTAEIALGPAEVFVTVGNTAKKAGALNQALASVSPRDEDVLLVM